MCSTFPAHIHPNDTTIIQSCEEHSRNTAKYAANAMESIGISSAAYLAGLLHDTGKYKQEFKVYLESSVNNENVHRGSVIHTFAGAKYLLQYHKQNSDYNFEFEDMISEILAYAVGAHHGLFDCVNESHENGFLHRIQTEPQGDLDAVRNFEKLCADSAELKLLFEKATDELIPLLKKCDDLAAKAETDERYFEEREFLCGLLIRLITSAVMEGDRRDTAEFMDDAVFAANADRELWKALLLKTETKLNTLPADTPINISRRKISDLCRAAADKPSGIYRLNVPTGGGKTLSALRYALAHAEKHGKKRIIFTSPLLSILDQNSRVIRDYVGDEFVLEHHSNIVQEQNIPAEKEQYKLLTDSWSAPIIVTTLVQLLNTMFDGKTSSVRRFHALTDAVIVIDEVQTVPGKMLALFNLTISFLAAICNTTILLCSATQPCLDEMNHPLRMDVSDIVPQDTVLWNVFKRTDIRFVGSYRMRDIPSYAEEVLQDTQSLLIVCNKKSESETVYHAMRDSDYDVFHLSAAMCMEHRRKTLHEIQASLAHGDRKTVCVSTQVIEAGVDISFGAVIRLTAGLDSIIQSAGRCNRNGESDQPRQVSIVRVLDENMTHLHEIKLAQQATDVLLDAYEYHPDQFDSDLSSEAAVRCYYKQLFAAQYQDNRSYHDYPVSEGITLFDLLSENRVWQRNGKPDPISFYFHQAFASAGRLFEVFDSDTTDVIVPWGDGADMITELSSERAKHDFGYVKELLQRARAYTVSLYAWQKRKLEEYGALIPLAEDIALGLAPEYYHNSTGVQIYTAKEAQTECNTLIW